MKPLFNHQYSLIKGPENSLEPWENENINQKPNLGPKVALLSYSLLSFTFVLSYAVIFFLGN